MQIAYTESQAIAPYREMFAQQRTDLSSVLEKRNVPASKIQTVAESGYILWHEKVFPPGASGPAVEVVHDGFYGKKWGYGFIPLNEFLYFLEHLPPHKVNPGSAPSYTVGSLREAEDILNRPRHAIFKQPGRMCFRGQTKEYFATRPYGNPNKRDQHGRERLIIPSHWRKFTSDFDARPFRQDPPLLLTTPRAGHLLYGDIPDWNQLEARRTRDFPLLNTLQKVLCADNLAAFKAFESEVNVNELLRSAKCVHERAYRRYNERWIKHNITAEMSEEPVLIEQHYGMPTMGLDLTFELSVAAFFATHQFVRPESKLADYTPLAEGEHQGVIYCFVFEDPPVVKSASLITKLELFDHCPPLRPLRQNCALEFFHSENFNEAAVELDAIFFLKQDFDVVGVPTKYELFPGPAEDSFYRVLIESKRKHIDIFEPVVEYAFN